MDPGKLATFKRLLAASGMHAEYGGQSIELWYHGICYVNLHDTEIDKITMFLSGWNARKDWE